MKLKSIGISLLAASLMLTSCGVPAAHEDPQPATSLAENAAVSLPTETEPALSPAEEILEGMTLRQKVGQLFIIRPDALVPASEDPQAEAPKVTTVTQEMADTLKDYPVGGFAQFKSNIVDPSQIQAFNAQLYQVSQIPPFIAVDEEGGLVARLARNDSFGLPKYESAAAVGQEGPEAALKMGQTIGSYLHTYGFNMDFAPVADTFTNPENKVIGTRAFSTDPNQVALCARAMADGLQENNIIPVFKHFPGHGDTVEDSHEQIAVSHKNLEELMACEWIPFRQAGLNDCMMSAHVALPEVTGDMTPSTLTPKVIKDCLKGKLGYQGLVITDALEMGAITENYTPAEAAITALQAGCDILLMPISLQEAFDGVVAAVEDGTIPEAELDQIVLRILNVKLQHNMIRK